MKCTAALALSSTSSRPPSTPNSASLTKCTLAFTAAVRWCPCRKRSCPSFTHRPCAATCLWSPALNTTLRSSLVAQVAETHRPVVVSTSPRSRTPRACFLVKPRSDILPVLGAQGRHQRYRGRLHRRNRHGRLQGQRGSYHHACPNPRKRSAWNCTSKSSQ